MVILDIMNFPPKPSRAAPAALVAFLILTLAALPAAGWSEFGQQEEAEETEGPEIRDPFFEFLLTMAWGDSVGLWTGEELRAHAAASGRESRFPLEDVVSVARVHLDEVGNAPPPGKYQGITARAVWTLVLKGKQDRPMPYSILGYHPGSLRIDGLLVLSELGPADLEITTVFESSVDLGEVVFGNPKLMNHPNPFNPRTTIAFDLPNQAAVNLRVFDLSGRLVRVLLDGEIFAEGGSKIIWNGRDDPGRRVASGTYFYRLEAGSFSETKSMVLIK